jgi:hypothetical protein
VGWIDWCCKTSFSLVSPVQIGTAVSWAEVKKSCPFF